MKDTIIKFDTVKTLESELLISKPGSASQVIVIGNRAEKLNKEWYENIWVSSLLIPILITLVTVIITKFINGKREKLEKNKIDEEINKLKAENANIRKSFQPIVISTLLQVQEKLINDKLTGLRQMIELRNEWLRTEIIYDEEGQPTRFSDAEYYRNLFLQMNEKFVSKVYDHFDRYAFLFPNKILLLLQQIKNNLTVLTLSRASYMQLDDEDVVDLDKGTTRELKQVIADIEKTIICMREDLHLNNTFVHDFIEENRKSK